MTIRVSALCAFLIILTSFQATRAQITTNPADTAGKRLDIINAERYNYQQKDSSGDFLSLAGNVKIRQGTSLFYCDSAVLNQKENIFEAFGNIHINDADSIHTYARYLKYYGRDKQAYLKNNVKLTDGKGVLTTNELDYNTLTKIGTYKNGGKVVNGKTVLTSQEGLYYGETKDVYFKKKVVLTDPDFKVTTDTLLYNTYTEIARFVAPTTIKNDQRTVKTNEGFYDMKNKKAVFGKRPFIDDKDYTLQADDIALDEATGFGDALGNAVYKSKDTANGSIIIANRLQSNSKTGALLATQKPLMILKQGADSIYIAADTLYSAKLSELKKTRTVPNILEVDSTATDSSITVQPPKADSSNRFVEAYYNVRIFSDSLQAVCDSLFYSFEDSAFRLLKNPIVWAQANQITGDTIYLYTKNKKPQRLYVFENAMAVNKVDEFYNQVRGNTINGYFINGDINFIKAKGSAENIYYGADEQGNYIGVNKATSDVIDMYFVDRKPERVVFRNNLEGVTSPMRQVDHSEMRLRGFQWYDSRRPKTHFELLGN